MTEDEENADRPFLDQIEENYWRSQRKTRAHEDQQLAENFETEANAIEAQIAEALGQRTRLAEALAEVRKEIKEKTALRESLLAKYEQKKRNLAADRKENDEEVGAWIARQRANRQNLVGGDEGDADDEHADSPINGGNSGWTERDTGGVAINGTREKTVSDSHGSSFRTSDEAYVTICDVKGKEVATLKRTSVGRKEWSELLGLPIKHRVQLRESRTITEEQLASISGTIDGHGTSAALWLSLMIQATGEVHRPRQACVTCKRGQGLFAQCTIVGSKDFPRCGNCEYKGQECQIADGHAATEPLHQLRQRQASIGTHVPKTTSTQQHTAAGVTPVNPTPPPHRTVADSSSLGSVQSTPSETPDFTDSPKSDGAELELPEPQKADDAEDADAANGSLETEITKDTLSLKHDGMIYLEPEIVRGVPVKKISPDHAYWEPNWKPIEALVKPKLDYFEARHDTYGPSDELSKDLRRRKHLDMRQINRGKAVMKFLHEGAIHPYQIIGKKWVTNGLTNYDTLFRLAATLDELGTFAIDVTPTEWVRQRLHEEYISDPQNFQPNKTIHNLYNDKKLRALREKNGHKTMGRPVEPAEGSGLGTANRGKLVKKRKEAPSSSTKIAPKKRATSAAGATKTAAAATGEGESRASKVTGWRQEHLPSRLSLRESPKKARLDQKQQQPLEHPLAAQQQSQARKQQYQALVDDATAPDAPGKKDEDDDDDDFAYDGYTSTDSGTRDKVTKIDWRLHQIKTDKLTTNTGTTQYWHFLDRGQDRDAPMFEHQVLRETYPRTTWGVFKDPIDFHLRFKEIVEIAYAAGRASLRTVVRTRRVDGVPYRGYFICHWKRASTKARFLAFMKRHNVRLVKTSRELIDVEWDKIQSPVMPGVEDEAEEVDQPDSN